MISVEFAHYLTEVIDVKTESSFARISFSSYKHVGLDASLEKN